MANTSKNLSVKDIGSGMLATSRKTQWGISSMSPKCVEDLSFVARDSENRMIWWSVVPPKTDYWHVHEVLGKAYAFELLDLMNNPDAEKCPPHILAYIAGAIHRWSTSVSPGAADGMTHGFFGVLSEYMSTGTANR